MQLKHKYLPLLCAMVLFWCVAAAPGAGLTVDAGEDQHVFTGANVSIRGIFTDPECDDSHIAVFDWGDNQIDYGHVNETNQTFTADHLYDRPGFYEVGVNVSNQVDEKAGDRVNVTVVQEMPVKVLPWNFKPGNNGVFTVFLTLADYCGIQSKDALTDVVAGGAAPEKVLFCRKDGGTLILKFRRNEVQATSQGTIGVSGTFDTPDGEVPFAGTDGAREHPANGVGNAKKLTASDTGYPDPTSRDNNGKGGKGKGNNGKGNDKEK